MATVVTNTTAKAIGSYVGETKKQIREGFGVYTYPNKYFRYEGEWKDGKKHGHGRLLMGDGSFYEGSFEHGEIQGHGFRKWTLSNNSYTGQFERGELCGSGVMNYGDGNRYEGTWQNNQREGDGHLTEANGNSYKGSFHQHKRHGEGYQVYSNGDQYEGDWVRGRKQGHGTMKYSDGTIYDGQWRDDSFNGQGSIIHVSGMMYEGLWISGRPAVESFTLSIHGPSIIEIEQGKPFNVEIECQTVDGELTQENGRLLQVTAGVKIPLNQSSLKRLGSENKASEQEKITTPFDFDVESYPLTELASDSDAPSTGGTGQWSSGGRQDQPSPIMEASEKNTGQVLELTKDSAEGQVSSDHVKSSTSLSPAPHISVSRPTSVHNSSSLAIEVEGDASSQFLFPIVPALRTVSGKAMFENLYLLPLPSGPRSYSLGLDERELMPDGRASQTQKWKKGRDTKKGSVAPSVMDVVERAEVKESKRKKEKKDDKTFEDRIKFCKPGDYVLIIRDITSPPFLGAVLQPAYLHVKVGAKVKRAKSKMDKR